MEVKEAEIVFPETILSAGEHKRIRSIPYPKPFRGSRFRFVRPPKLPTTLWVMAIFVGQHNELFVGDDGCPLQAPLLGPPLHLSTLSPNQQMVLDIVNRGQGTERFQIKLEGIAPSRGGS